MAELVYSAGLGSCWRSLQRKATYLFDFYSDNDKDYSILSDDKIKNICSSIECELDFVTDLKDDENA